MDRSPSWQTTVVAGLVIALVAMMFWRATEDGPDFETIWAAVGTIVGVVTGAIPAFFFRSDALKAQAEKTQALDGQRRADARAELYAMQLDPTQRTAVEGAVTNLFR